MFPNASGDAPPREDSKQQILFKSNDALLWQSTHEKWKTFDDVRSEGLFFDVALKSTDGKSFPAHRIILCACSPYFKSLFSGRWESGNRREISIPGVSACVLNHILQFAYNREVYLSSLKETKELLIAANHFGIEEIVQDCFLFLLHQMNLVNCLDIWDFARTYYCHDLEAATKAFILKHIVDIVCAPSGGDLQSIWNLSAEDLLFFLEDAELNIPEESLTFWIIIRWIKHNPSERHKFIYQLLLSIRWTGVNPEFVENCVRNNTYVQFCKDARFVLNKIEGLRLLRSGFGYLTEYVRDQLEAGRFRIDLLPPPSVKRDLNGNFLVPSVPAQRSKLVKKWSTPRLPRSLILVVGGWCEDSPSKSVEIYEPRSKKWKATNKALPSILKRPRAYHSVLYNGGFMYVIGGFDGNNTYNSCDRYDVAQCHWQEMCSMHSRRCYVGVAFLDGCIYAFGGSDGSEAARLKSAEKFYPSKNIWKQLPDMHERRSDAGGCSLGRRVYVAGGFTGEECVFSVESYDTDAKQWTRVSRMAVARSGVSVVSYRDRVVVLGGYDGHNRLKSVEAYDPQTNQWSMLKPMQTKRSNFTACIIEDKLVVIGGFNGNSTCSDVEYYDDEFGNYRVDFSKDIQSAMCDEERNFTDPHSKENKVGECSVSFASPSFASINTPKFFRKSKIRLENGRWRHLPNMKMSRSALSCCVLTELAPKFLHSLMETDS